MDVAGAGVINTGGDADPSGELLRLTAAPMKAWWRKTGLQVICIYLGLTFLSSFVNYLIYFEDSNSGDALSDGLIDWMKLVNMLAPFLVWYLAVLAAQRCLTAARAGGAAPEVFTPLACFRLYTVQAVPPVVAIVTLRIALVLLQYLGSEVFHWTSAVTLSLDQDLQTPAFDVLRLLKLGWLLCLLIAFRPSLRWLWWLVLGGEFFVYGARLFIYDPAHWPDLPRMAWPVGCALAFAVVAYAVWLLWRGRDRLASQLVIAVLALRPAGAILKLLCDATGTPQQMVGGLHFMLKGVGFWTSFATLRFAELNLGGAQDVPSLWLEPLINWSVPANDWAIVAAVIFNFGLLITLYWVCVKVAQGSSSAARLTAADELLPLRSAQLGSALLAVTAAPMRSWWYRYGWPLVAAYAVYRCAELLIFYYKFTLSPGTPWLPYAIDGYFFPLIAIWAMSIWLLAARRARELKDSAVAEGGLEAGQASPMQCFVLYALQGLPLIFVQMVLLLLGVAVRAALQLGQTGQAMGLNHVASHVCDALVSELGWCRTAWLLCCILALNARGFWFWYASLASTFSIQLLHLLLPEGQRMPQGEAASYLAGVMLGIALVSCGLYYLVRRRFSLATWLIGARIALSPLGVLVQVLLFYALLPRDGWLQLQSLLIGAKAWAEAGALNFGQPEIMKVDVGEPPALWLEPFANLSWTGGSYYSVTVLVFNLALIVATYYFFLWLAGRLKSADAAQARPAPVR